MRGATVATWDTDDGGGRFIIMFSCVDDHEQSFFTAGFVHDVDSMAQEGNWDMIVTNALEHYMVISSHPWSPTIWH